jgi:hypothetical protein
MEERYDREMLAEGGCSLTMAAARSWADMEPTANCGEEDDFANDNLPDEDDVPIAQQLGILPRLQKSGDAFALPVTPSFPFPPSALEP